MANIEFMDEIDMRWVTDRRVSDFSDGIPLPRKTGSALRRGTVRGLQAGAGEHSPEFR